jgi:hypothetical protein
VAVQKVICAERMRPVFLRFSSSFTIAWSKWVFPEPDGPSSRSGLGRSCRRPIASRTAAMAASLEAPMINRLNTRRGLSLMFFG